MPAKTTYKLVPELVPRPLWGRSAASMLRNKAAWKKKIRPDTLAAGGNRCCICGAEEGRLICHDKWQYDDKAATATLIGFEIHCGMCDTVAHHGRAQQYGDDAEQVMQDVRNHLCRVNRCSAETAQRIIDDAWGVWYLRNEKRWTVRVAHSLIERYPLLAALPEFVPAAIRRLGPEAIRHALD